MAFRSLVAFFSICLVFVACCSAACAQDSGGAGTSPTSAEAPHSDSAASASGAAKSPPTPAYATILKDAKTYSGMFTLYQKGSSLFAEFTGSEYSQEYIVLISIARGIGHPPLLGGFSWSFGDDWVWQFRKVDDRVLLVRKNVRFRATRGSPEYSAVQNAYTDSVLFSLRTMGKGPKGGDLVDFTPVFMSDLPQIGSIMPGFAFSPDRSTWGAIKPFERNMELEVVATYAVSGRMELETVPDARGATINVHYSISQLRPTGYQPRLADDRVGYFLTVIKDFSKETDREQFVRFINRWHLEKPPGAKEPPYAPKQPIVFWIEKTVPHRFRKAVREGLEEWNKAFEKAGWLNAIEVRQQPDDADWDPENIAYNTFRWITSNAGFSMGPSRVNPYSGQILDADIIFDADFLQFWKEEYQTYGKETGLGRDGARVDEGQGDSAAQARWDFSRHPACQLSHGMARQLAFGSAAVWAQASAPQSAVLQEKLIMQGLKEIVMHEVGHTLGLRHNFKGSRNLSLKELNDPAKTRETGMVASVMDYNPTNLVPKDWQQGDYYPTTLGAYDYWAIEYGYKPLSGSTEGDLAELKKIASRSGERALHFATDEDTEDSDPDPDSNLFDLGSDALEYAKSRAQLIQEILPTLVDRTTKDGEDYTQTRRAFSVLLDEHWQAMQFVARSIGGLHTSRSHKGDKDAPPPLALVDAAKQRAAISLLEEQVFSDKPFQFSPDLYQRLAAPNWTHWGVRTPEREDFPIHEVISRSRAQILGQLLSAATLQRMHDTELRAAPTDDLLTAAEMIQRLTKTIFSEVDTLAPGDFTDRKPAISSLRRNLQREYLRRLSSLAMGRTAAPDDCQTVAYAELSALETRMRKLLQGHLKLDSYSRAHLQESADSLRRLREAHLMLFGP